MLEYFVVNTILQNLLAKGEGLASQILRLIKGLGCLCMCFGPSLCNGVHEPKQAKSVFKHTISTLSIRTSYLLTILVLKIKIVHSATS